MIRRLSALLFKVPIECIYTKNIIALNRRIVDRQCRSRVHSLREIISKISDCGGQRHIWTLDIKDLYEVAMQSAVSQDNKKIQGNV